MKKNKIASKASPLKNLTADAVVRAGGEVVIVQVSSNDWNRSAVDRAKESLGGIHIKQGGIAYHPREAEIVPSRSTFDWNSKALEQVTALAENTTKNET